MALHMRHTAMKQKPKVPQTSVSSSDEWPHAGFQSMRKLNVANKWFSQQWRSSVEGNPGGNRSTQGALGELLRPKSVFRNPLF